MTDHEGSDRLENLVSALASELRNMIHVVNRYAETQAHDAAAVHTALGSLRGEMSTHAAERRAQFGTLMDSMADLRKEFSQHLRDGGDPRV